MKLDIDPVFTTDPPVFLLKDLTVRPLEEQEHCRAGKLLEQQHYLAIGPRGGNFCRWSSIRAIGLPSGLGAGLLETN